MIRDSAPPTPGIDSSQPRSDPTAVASPNRGRGPFAPPGIGVGDLWDFNYKLPRDVPKAERRGMIRCVPARHVMGVLTKDELVRFTGSCVSLSGSYDVLISCPQCPRGEQTYRLHMDRLRDATRHWRRRAIVIKITDIATLELDPGSPRL